MAKVIAFFLSIIQFFSIIFSGQSLLPVTNDGETAAMETQERCEERAKILANSFYRNYYVKPFNVLVMNDDFTGIATNWEYGALLSLSLSMAQIDESYLEGIDYAYDNYRSTSKLRYEGTAIPHSWAYGFGKENDDMFVQNVCSNAEIYARLALYAD